MQIDILDKLPIPFGLVRFGVAPDHPEIKVGTVCIITQFASHQFVNNYACFIIFQNCINQFTVLGKTEQCRFIGNVGLGRDVSLAQLRPYYHAIVMVS